MSLSKLFNRIFFHNNTTPALDEDNFNAMSKAINDIDDRVINLAGTIMEDVPQIQEDIEELEEDFELIDGKITEAQAAAASAQNSANAAAGSVTSAQQKALIAEGWAKGTQNGSPVSQSSPYWQNNAEYFKDQAKNFTPTGYQDLVDEVEDVKQTLSDLTDTVEDTEPYVLRQSKGNMVDMSLVGGSLAWNQLAPTIESGKYGGLNASISFSDGAITCACTSNGYFGTYAANVYKVSIKDHVYLFNYSINPSKSATFKLLFDNSEMSVPNANVFNSIMKLAKAPSNNAGMVCYMKNGVSGTDSFVLKDYMCIDLTALFGSSTIADYIYSLEQATAGAGVAWFRQYFPKAYYGYQSGKIESVNVASRKVVGKNLWNGRMNELIPVNFPAGTKLTYSCDVASGGTTLNLYSDSTTSRYDYFTLNTYTERTIILTERTTGFMLTGSATPVHGQIEIGDSATVYEPYQSLTYAFDSSKQLRGIFYLDANNKLCANGDIWKANEGITRRYRIVDLGSLNWTYANSRFSVTLSDIKNNGASRSINGMIVNGYNLNTIGNDKDMFKYEQALYIYDSDYNNETSFKQHLTDKNIKLVYELATPTTESATPFQNPQRAFIDGTEEFIYDNEVAVPVGHNSTYYLNETLPQSEDYTDGAVELLKNGKIDITALGTDESGRTTASRAYTTGEFFYMDGKMYKVLTSIASGATFTVGTNCQQTTLFAELKALA